MLWDELTVEEHVRIWNNIKCSISDNLAHDDLIEACNLSLKKNARADTLSGGQKRKLQLACMFVGGSTVCLLDEVSSGLVSNLKILLPIYSPNRTRCLDVLSGILSRPNGGRGP